MSVLGFAEAPHLGNPETFSLGRREETAKIADVLLRSRAESEL